MAKCHCQAFPAFNSGFILLVLLSFFYFLLLPAAGKCMSIKSGYVGKHICTSKCANEKVASATHHLHPRFSPFCASSFLCGLLSLLQSEVASRTSLSKLDWDSSISPLLVPAHNVSLSPGLALDAQLFIMVSFFVISMYFCTSLSLSSLRMGAHGHLHECLVTLQDPDYMHACMWL